ncbi:MAG: ParB/RepB/Spo0J family partition protein, partial [Thermomicrobiales bacterium]
DDIRPNPWQPRTQMDQQQLQELADSIRTHGVMQPLVVSAPDANAVYTLIAGERRWRASRLAGEQTVPVIIKDAVPQAMLELALVENVVRADLSPIEEALAYRQLMDEFGLSQAAIAERVGRSRVAVTNTIRLLSAPDRVREALLQGQITEGHARALLGLTTSVDQLAALDLVLERELTVRQTEDLVRRWGEVSASRPSQPTPTGDETRVEEGLRSALGTRVAFRRNPSGKGGTVTIQFYSDEHLHDLYSRLVGEDEW